MNGVVVLSVLAIVTIGIALGRILSVSPQERVESLREGGAGRRVERRVRAKSTGNQISERVSGQANERSYGDEGQFIAALISQLEGGSDVRTCLERVAGRRFALPRDEAMYVAEALAAACGPERGEHGLRRRARACARITMCIRLSEVLGSRLVESLRVVRTLYEQERRLEDLRAQAFSMPRATVKLLAALPVITLCGGEVLGAHSFAFLTGSAAGWMCCLCGLGLFGAGWMWMRRLLRDFGAS